MTEFPQHRHAQFLIALIVCSAAIGSSSADGPTSAPAGDPPLTLASEREVWLIDRGNAATRGYRGGIFIEPGLVEPLPARALTGCVVGEQLSLFTTSGELFQNGSDGWRRQLDLPRRLVPISLAAGSNRLFGIVPVDIVRELSPTTAASKPANALIDIPASATLALVQYDGIGWTPLAALPASVRSDSTASARLTPKLAIWEGSPTVVWLAGDRKIAHASFDIASSRWGSIDSLALDQTALEFWPVALGARTPAITIAYAAGDGTEALLLYRRLPDGRVLGPWQPTEITWSADVAIGAPQRFRSVAAYDQQLVAQSETAAGAPVLRFARIDGKPTEKSIDLRNFLDELIRPNPVAEFVKTFTLVVMVGVLAMLFLLRGRNVAAPAVLPPGTAPALAFQRIFAMAIDFLPIAFVVGLITDVGLTTGVRQLLGWAYHAPGAPPVPPNAVLIWWGASALLFIVYAFIAEARFGRTLGKSLLGLRVISEKGERPAIGAVAMRNALRVLDLLPPLWLLLFLVFLTPKRQRLGDLFARCIVIRNVPIEELPPPPQESDVTDE